MRKKLDIIWEKSTLWESVEKWVVKYLKENHAEYQEMQMQSMHLVEDTPALWKLMNDSNGVTLDSEDHEALHKYFEIENGRQIFELEYYFFAGQMMAFSYGSMLAQLKKELLGENSEISSHLIELITGIRSDELEKQLQEESEEYQECIREEDILFSSSSAAADFVLGYSVSGPQMWKAKDGRSLKEIESVNTGK